MLVIGSRNSSNSVRLVEVARDCGTDAHLIDNCGEVQEQWLEGRRVVGISSGASAPENLVSDLVEFFRRRGVTDISEFDVVSEDVRFMLPKQIREAVPAAGPPPGPRRRPGRRPARPPLLASASAGPHVMRTLIISDLHLGSVREPMFSAGLRSSSACWRPLAGAIA